MQFKQRSINLDSRHYWLGLTSAIKWARDPLSEDGAKQVARFALGFQGAQFLADVETLRQHPVGQRLLEQRPDLQRALSPQNLACTPSGSFGHAYYQMACQEEVSPLFLVGGLAYRDGFFDALNIDADTFWYLERQLFVHDATHILSGYGTDLAGEGLNILFNLGHAAHTPGHKRYRNVAAWKARRLVNKASCPEWLPALDEAFDRGAAAADCLPAPCIPWEELIAMPLDEARSFCGVSPLPDDWDTSKWCEDSDYGMEAKTAEQQAFESRLASLVWQGLCWRDFMRADESTRARVQELVLGGACLEEVSAAL